MTENKNRQQERETKATLLGLSDPCFHAEKMSGSAEKAINQAKSRDRPQVKLDEWKQKNYHAKDITKQLFNFEENIDRKNIQNFALSDFKQNYQALKKPVVIKGCTQTWKSRQFWNHNSMTKLFSNQLFKIGEDDDGAKLKISMKSFMEYLVHNTDDSPLYLFENINIVSAELRTILEAYKVPSYFEDDILALLEDKDRPLYRWFLMGPERSGSTVHTDPLMTAAWNTSLVGHKRWVLFDQRVPNNIVKGKEFRPKGYTDQAINYFVEILPQLRQKYSKENLGLVQFIQYPGQTVFIPSGMWHAVLNIDDTMAVTQNFINDANLEAGWRAIESERKTLVAILLPRLKETNNQLYLKVKQLQQNNDDSEMSDSQQESPLKVKDYSVNSHSLTISDHNFEVIPETRQPRPRVSSQSSIAIPPSKQKALSLRGCSSSIQMV